MNLRGNGTLELTENGHERTESAEAVRDPLIGRRMLHYIVEEAIGQGGMSVVYRGTDELLHRPVAIKVLHPFLAKKADCRARLAREARAVARLKHENILKIFAYSGDPPTQNERPSPEGISQEGPPHEDVSGEGSAESWDKPKGVIESRDLSIGFLVTEFVPGDTLKRFWTSNRLWELPEAGALCCWVLAKALAHAHEQGVVHRDLKPENVMVRDDGVIKLMDFGIAQVVDTKSLTVTGTLLGSPAHMAPENIEGYPADARSDIFSLGTVLYWLTTGELPFEAISPHALLKAIVDVDFTPPQQRQPRISDDILKVLKRSMAKKPDDRYADAEAFADALAEALENAGVHASFATCNELLRRPAEEIGPLQERVRRAFLDKASDLLHDGHTARALSILGRVMADTPNDDEVAFLLERLNSMADEEEDEDGDEDGDEDEDAAEVETPVLGAFDEGFAAEESGLVHAPRGEAGAKNVGAASGREKFYLAPLVATVSIATLLGLTAIIAGQVEGSETPDEKKSERELALREKRPSEVKISVLKGKQKGPNELPNKNPRTRTPRFLGNNRILDRLRKSPSAAEKSARANALRMHKKEGMRTNLLSEGLTPQNPTNDKSKKGVDQDDTNKGDLGDPHLPTREIELRVVPWADVFVNRKKVATGVKGTLLHLTPGEHEVVLKNHLAKKEWRRMVRVPRVGQGKVPNLRVSLSPKPASLMVKANVDADVILVDAKTHHRLFVGQAAQSESHPIHIELPTGDRTYEVVFTKNGYRSKTVQRRFTAGKMEIVKVVLEAETNASTKAATEPSSPSAKAASKGAP
ncbi:MAG: serine/threonine protein kinase [Deltaproteobacteria bacterium]|nr:serine/threonine protein kinase [Deltaproteobacteria bacterium]